VVYGIRISGRYIIFSVFLFILNILLFAIA